MKNIFRAISAKVSLVAGSAAAFVGAMVIILVWATTGPLFDFSDTWQLIINTGTTIVTFLMVFLIQNTQNRDGKAMQLKLDELIRATRARDAFVELEQLSDEELAELDKEFRALHDKEATGPLMRKLHRSLQVENQRRHSKGSGRLNDLLHKKI